MMTVIPRLRLKDVDEGVLKEFKQFLEEEGLNEGTIRAFDSLLRRVAAVLPPSKPLEELTLDGINAWIERLPISLASKGKHRSKAWRFNLWRRKQRGGGS